MFFGFGDIQKFSIPKTTDYAKFVKFLHTEFCGIWSDSVKHTVESLQSHMILTMSHWSSVLTCLLPATRLTGLNPLGGLM
jgi:hypothetical protein